MALGAPARARRAGKPRRRWNSFFLAPLICFLALDRTSTLLFATAAADEQLLLRAGGTAVQLCTVSAYCCSSGSVCRMSMPEGERSTDNCKSREFGRKKRPQNPCPRRELELKGWPRASSLQAGQGLCTVQIVARALELCAISVSLLCGLQISSSCVLSSSRALVYQLSSSRARAYEPWTNRGANSSRTPPRVH